MPHAVSYTSCMGLTKRLAIIGGKVYVVAQYGLTESPQRRLLGWELATDPSRVTHGQHVSGGDFGRYSWRGPTGLACSGFLVGGANAQAQIDIVSDVPPPKVRKGVEVRWDGCVSELGAWLKATKKGWVAA